MGDLEGGPVLVVEDDPSIRELLVEALHHEGIPAIPAADGPEAIRLALEKRPALVLLDLGLPFIDGAAVAARIREAHGEAVPFVVMTAGRRIDEAASRVRALGYLAKPFDIDDLVRAVRGAIAPPSDAAADEVRPSIA
jgi:two-component system chemotaxis response regulator CheY